MRATALGRRQPDTAAEDDSVATAPQVYMSLYVPWPFNDVGFVVEANGADLYEEEGRLIIAFASPDSKVWRVQTKTRGGRMKHGKLPAIMTTLVATCVWDQLGFALPISI